MAGAGTQADLSGGVQQMKDLPLEFQRQVAIAGAKAEGERAAGKLALDLLLHLVTHLLHTGGGTAVQGQGPEHVPALPAADEGVGLGREGGAEYRRPVTALQVLSQITPRKEQAALQAHAVLLQGDVQPPPRPPGPCRRLHLPGTGLHQGPGLGIRLLGGAAHVPQHLVQVQRGQCAGHGVIHGGWRPRCR